MPAEVIHGHIIHWLMALSSGSKKYRLTSATTSCILWLMAIGDFFLVRLVVVINRSITQKTKVSTKGGAMFRLAAECEESTKKEAFSAVRVLVASGWELVDLRSDEIVLGLPRCSQRAFARWTARLMKGHNVIYVEISPEEYGLIGADFRCPVCNAQTAEDWCEVCEREITPRLRGEIPEEYITGGEYAKTFNN